MEKYKKIVELMPALKRYSIVLLVYLVTIDPYLEGVSLTHKHIMEKTGLCERSLGLAIRELEEKRLLTRRGYHEAEFIVHL